MKLDFESNRRLKIHSNQMEEVAGVYSEYPYVLHKLNFQGNSVPWHWHDELEFNYIISGEEIVRTTSGTYHFHAGEGFFTNSKALCSMEYIGNCLIDCHLFHSTFLSGHFRSIFETKYLNPVLQNRKIELIEFRGNTKPQIMILNKLKQVGELQQEEHKEFQTRNLFSEIWLLLLEEIQSLEETKPSLSSVYQNRLLTMLSFIQENYADKISLEKIAASAMISEREALRCFQTSIQETPFEYLMNYRVEMAKNLLKATTLSMTEIAAQTGFSNSAYFSKIFKRACHMTPLEYRKSVQNQ